MRYRVSNVPLWLDEEEDRLVARGAERLGISVEHLSEVLVVRRSLDARKKGHARWLVNVEVTVAGEVRGTPADVAPVAPPDPPPPRVRRPEVRPIVLGAGPAGLFCAWALLERGVPTVVVDRGKPVGPRRLDVAALMRGGELDPESNMNFGEGGAGAYTDGKLGTRIHHPAVRKLFELFAARGWPIEAKAFAAGFRAEHPQALIDRIQYGTERRHAKLPPADYRLADNPKIEGESRGVFSFCMCPGGVVVPTPTEPGLQCTNGMSNSNRSSRLANAGVGVAVSPADFEAEGFTGPLAGLAWQRRWEREAYRLGGGGYRAPAQRLAAYLAGRPGAPPNHTSYRPGVTAADLSVLYPPRVRAALRAGLAGFGRRMRGFVTEEALLMGVETRTSSPCRLVRGDDFQSPALRGVYPAGEGAGYAGGIVSSAVDGLRVAEAICGELGPA